MRFDGIDIDGVLYSNEAVDNLVDFRTEEEAASGSEWLVGIHEEGKKGIEGMMRLGGIRKMKEWRERER